MVSDRTYLKNVLQRISRVETYTAGGREVFFKERLIQDAAAQNVTSIHQMLKQISQPITGFRDVLTQDYPYVNHEEVWGVVEDYLPDLKIQIETILAEMEAGES